MHDVNRNLGGVPLVGTHQRTRTDAPAFPYPVTSQKHRCLAVLVEIIYPTNRIVIDYGSLDDLVLLGAVDVATDRTFGPDAVDGWPGPIIERFDHATLADALAAEPRDNREGFVVWFPATDIRIKIKYAEYVRLHRIVTGLNARSVWEAYRPGKRSMSWSSRCRTNSTVGCDRSGRGLRTEAD